MASTFPGAGNTGADRTPAKPTMASQLENRLRDDICKGIFPPGRRLAIKEIADYYQAGAIPVREALTRLSASGFITAEDQKGFRVSDVSEAEIRDVTRTRLLIESEALSEAIRVGDLDWETGITSAHHRLNRLPILSGELQTLNPLWEAAHKAFHMALLAGCESPWQLRFARTLSDQSSRYRSLSTQYEEAHSRDLSHEHSELAEAALARNATRACQLLTEHYERTTSIIVKNIPPT